MSHEQPPGPPAQPPVAGAGRGGQRGHLRLRPARRQLVDQQHRLPRRRQGRRQRRRLLDRTAHSRLPRAAIARVTDRPVRTLVNTHHHGDHTFGNYLFPGATIVGHEKVRDGILGVGTAQVRAVLDRRRLGGHRARAAVPHVRRPGHRCGSTSCAASSRSCGTPAHTTNDSVRVGPRRKLLFSGDLLFNGGTPFLAAGSISGALVALERLAGLGAETIVPGHGPVCGPEVIGRVTAYARFVQDVAARWQGGRARARSSCARDRPGRVRRVARRRADRRQPAPRLCRSWTARPPARRWTSTRSWLTWSHSTAGDH